MLQKMRKCKMMQDDNLYIGLVGTAISATGASLSVTDLQAIISIIVTMIDMIACRSVTDRPAPIADTVVPNTPAAI